MPAVVAPEPLSPFDTAMLDELQRAAFDYFVEHGGGGNGLVADTSLLLSGMVTAAAYFSAASADETELRERVDGLYRRVDWRWAQPQGAAVVHGWHRRVDPMKRAEHPSAMDLGLVR